MGEYTIFLRQPATVGVFTIHEAARHAKFIANDAFVPLESFFEAAYPQIIATGGI